MTTNSECAHLTCHPDTGRTLAPAPRRHNKPLRLAGVLGLFVCAGAWAQTQSTASLERQTDEAFRQVLQQPQNLSTWSKYAQLLVEAGNYEGGIAALERLLLDPQAPPELRVDIAALYFRLGSYAMAESMLREALADNRLQGEKRQLGVALLNDVLKRNRRSQLSGSVAIGVGYQTNPMFRTDDDQVFANGFLVPVPQNQKPDGDSDFTLGLRAQHLYALDKQNSAAIASTFGAYWVNYSSSHGSTLVANPTEPYDLLVLDLTTGLQFQPLPTRASGLTMRPYFVATNTTAQQHQYLSTLGAGLNVNWRTNQRTLLELTLDGQDRHFAQRIDVPDADNLDGPLYTFLARVSREIGGGQVLAGEFAWRHNSTGRDFYDYDSYEVRASYSISYRSLFGGGYWTTTLWAGALTRPYGAPDPSINPNETREDREWRVGIGQTVRLTPLWSLLLGADYATNDANLPNFRYQNTSVSAAVARTF